MLISIRAAELWPAPQFIAILLARGIAPLDSKTIFSLLRHDGDDDGDDQVKKNKKKVFLKTKKRKKRTNWCSGLLRVSYRMYCEYKNPLLGEGGGGERTEGDRNYWEKQNNSKNGGHGTIRVIRSAWGYQLWPFEAAGTFLPVNKLADPPALPPSEKKHGKSGDPNGCRLASS
jgi:hypothetical protein